MSEAVLRGRSERVRGRGILTGSTITGGSSISFLIESALPPALGLAFGVVSTRISDDRLAFSSLSLSLMPRNLLDFRDCLVVDEDGVDGISGLEAELPLARLSVLGLLEGSVTDLDRSLFACF